MCSFQVRLGKGISQMPKIKTLNIYSDMNIDIL